MYLGSPLEEYEGKFVEKVMEENNHRLHYLIYMVVMKKYTETPVDALRV